MAKRDMQTSIDSLNQCIKFKALNGFALLNALSARVRLTRQLFIKDLEGGDEIRIPELLSQDHLPMSFRYYDPILVNIQEGISIDVQ